jgi:hypothetical protein
METENTEFYKYSENGIKKRNFQLWETISNYTDKDITFKEKFYLYENGINNIPICECGSHLKFIDMKNGYRQFCSKNCMFQSSVIKERRKETNINKWGVDNPSKSTVVKNKIKNTNNQKFGTDWATQNENIKEKRSKTNLEKWGVDNPSKVREFREKAENTMLKKFGVKHAMQSDQIKKDLYEYFLDKWGVDNPSKVRELREKAEDTMMNKWGVKYALQNEYLLQKLKDTNFERYGHQYPSQNTDIMSKMKETNLEKYGFDNPSKSEKVKEKIKDSILKKYNTLNLNSVPEISDKIRNTNLRKYGIEHISKNEEYRSKYKISNHVNYIKYLDNGLSLFKCDCRLDHEFEIYIDNYISRTESNLPLCTICYPIDDLQSIKEKEFFKFINLNYNGPVIESYRDELEIDIFLPDLKLGFEFNGLYWHSEKHKNQEYHLKKTNYFKEKGIRIIHVWEDDWDFKRQIIESQIVNLLKLNTKKIFARKCQIQEINDVKIIREFLDKNHIQGFCNSVLKLGLFYNDVLVSIMIFDHYEGRKKMNNDEWNLSRFCNKVNYTVIGSASKMLKYFLKNHKPKRIISYADKDWSIGDLYYKLGFEKVSEIKPDYKYIFKNKRNHKSNFKKSNLQIIDKNITEKCYTEQIGINRIWDCGKIKFELKLAD